MLLTSRPRVALFVLTAALISNSVAAQSQKLSLGQAPPAVTTAKWIQGQELKEFDVHKTYVVEFWATWCGPCKASIPHLNKLSKKFAGKVTFNGISIWENRQNRETPYLPTVEKFVQDKGDAMSYNVGADTKMGDTAKAWMTGQPGIPTAFIVHQGKVVWYGHPMVDLESTLDEIVTGKFNAESVARKIAERDARDSAGEETGKIAAAWTALHSKKDYVGGLKVVNEAIASKPSLEPSLRMLKFEAMLWANEQAAYRYAKTLKAEGKATEPEFLNGIAWRIAEGSAPIAKPDYNLALDMAKQAVSLTKGADWMILDTLAVVHGKRGEFKEAYLNQKKAMDLIKKENAELPAADLKEMTDRLADFKKKAGV